MTIRFPDVSHYQGTMSLGGVDAAIAKATQGVSYKDPTYGAYKGQMAGRLFAAYHWLDTADAVAQARNAFSVVGPNVPLMIDDEQNIVTVQHTLDFVHAY